MNAILNIVDKQSQNKEKIFPLYTQTGLNSSNEKPLKKRIPKNVQSNSSFSNIDENNIVLISLFWFLFENEWGKNERRTMDELYLHN